MSELVDCINSLSAKDIIKSIAKTANGTPFYLQTSGLTGGPDSIAGLEFWFDGQDATTFALNGNKVTQWDDKSGNARHVGNAVDAERPTWSAVTGRVTFVAASSTTLTSGLFVVFDQPITVFVLYKLTGALNVSMVAFGGIGAATNVFAHASLFKIRSATMLAAGATNANDNIHVAEFNGVTSNYWINGVLGAGPGDAGAVGMGQIIFGATTTAAWYADMEVMEAFGYSRVLSVDERTDLSSYLTNKWGL